MLSEEVKRYRELSGDNNPHTPISRIGGYLDGYEKALEQEPKTEKVIKMRDVTPEERESIEKYIKSISKPTGVDFGKLEQEPKTGWIPVSERLPENYGEYICTMSNDNVQECGFVPSGEKGLIPGWSKCEADGFKKLDYRDIKAWMPLPLPYKAETE